MDQAITAQSISITGADGDDVEAYFAAPQSDTRRGGVIVIHHLPGYERWSKEVLRRFAVDGYNTICVNLYSRQAPGAEPDDAAAVARSQGGVPDAQVIGDMAGAASYLRGLDTSNGKVAVMGHCSGGRQAVLTGCNTDVDAIVDCYGGFVIGNPPPDIPYKATSLEDQLSKLSAPVLGLFGKDDAAPSPDQVATLDRLLTEYGVEHEFTSYEGAGHAFFAVDRPAYRVEAALDGYARIGRFFTEKIG